MSILRQVILAVMLATTAVQAIPSADVCCGSPTNCPKNCGRVRYTT